MTRLSEWEEFQDDDLDLGTADLLLDGALSGSDVPPGYESIAALVKTVKRGLRPDEMDWEPPVVAAMISAVRPPAPARPGRRSSHRLLLRPGIAMVAGAAGLLSGSMATAAAGALPAAVQTAVHNAAATIGVSVPNGPSGHRSVTVSGGGSGRLTGRVYRPGPPNSAPSAPSVTVSPGSAGGASGRSPSALGTPSASRSVPTDVTIPAPAVGTPNGVSGTGTGATESAVSTPSAPSPTSPAVPTTPTTAAPGPNGHAHSGKSSTSHPTAGH